MTLDPVIAVRCALIANSVVLGVFAALSISRRRQAPHALAFGLLTLAGAIYSFGYAGEATQTTVADAVHWQYFEYLALPWIPGLWLLAAFRHNRITTPGFVFFIIPIITAVGRFTNHWHGLFFGPFGLEHRGPFALLVISRGPLADLDNTYLLASFLIALVIYARAYRDLPGRFRHHALLSLSSAFVPMAAYFVYLLGWSPWGLDIAPMSLAVNAALCYYAMFHQNTLNIAPLERKLIFSGMRDSVLLVDEHLRLVDFNDATRELLPTLGQQHIGLSVAQVFARFPALSQRLLNREDGTITVPANDTIVERHLELRTFPLTAHSGALGFAAILADVTANTRSQAELLRNAETDALTGVANRRRFLQALDTECARFNRQGDIFSLLMVDVDHFKRVNDRFGHPAGDAVLRELAARVQGCLRAEDLLGRYGGEEFIVLLVEAGCDAALLAAERVRAIVAATDFALDGLNLPVTVSVGVATQFAAEPAESAALIKQADLALYRAKEAGRNCVFPAEMQFVPAEIEAGPWAHATQH